MANKNRLKQGEETVTTQTPKTRFNPDQVPTLEQCQQQVRELAYELWEAAGYPEGDGSDFWVEAEKQLFGGMTNGGYRIYVGEEKNPTPQAFILTATGLLDEDAAAAETESESNGQSSKAPANTKTPTPVTA